MSFSYAAPTSGPSAGGIGWFNFGALSLAPGQSQQGLTGTLNDGTVVTFDVSVSNVSGANRTFTAGTVPTWGGAFFGNTNYTGVAGNVALNSSLTFAISDNAITISNITVKDALNNPVPNYTVLVGDAESTGVAERWSFNTNGAPWSLFTTIGNTTDPTLTGLGTQTAVITGNNPAVNHNEFILATSNPSTLVLSTATTNTAGGQQAIVVGFAVTKVSVVKDVVGRLDPSDQFKLDVTGNYPATATTTGSATGIQTATAVSYGLPTTPYTVNESMAPGSANPRSAYTQTVTAVNLTPDQTAPVGGALPLTITPVLGDNIIYTVKNSIAAPTLTKSVDKAFAAIGEVITYSLQIQNPNGGVMSDVKIQDAIPSGTTLVPGSVTSTNSTVVGTDPSLGLVLNGIPANTTATVSWKVLVAAMPVPNPIPNTATMIEPTGTTVVSNQVTTQVNSAIVATVKTVDKAFADVGDTLTYSITVTNSGNVPANNVVLTDALPAGVTFVAGSLTNATGTPPTLTLTNPVPAGGSVVVTYKVLVGAAVPNPNPVANSAAAAFAYTVDPAQPNGATGTSSSNVVDTQVNTAKLALMKSVDKAIAYLGDVVTYQIAVTNTGNVPANSVVISDVIPTGLVYVPGSLAVSTPATGDPTTAISLTNPIAPGQTVAISFQATVAAIPNPNPAPNTAKTAYTYTVDPQSPNAAAGSGSSNTVYTVVFRNNYKQQISDLIHSVALEQAALAAIANAEGAKIQRIAAMPGVTPAQLLCLNRSVSAMMDSMAILEAVLKQKLSVVACQIDGVTC